jgi:hypothetical protein
MKENNVAEEQIDIIYSILYSAAGIAIMPFLIHYVLHLSFKNRFFAKLIGTLLSFMFLSAAYTSWKELRSIPDHPEEISITEASQRLSSEDHLWVSLTGGEWDCSSLTKAGETNTVIVYRGKEQNETVVVTYDRKITCKQMADLQPVGRLDKIEKGRRAFLSNFLDFSKYGSPSVIFEICTYCGKFNSRLGVVFGTIIGLLTVLFFEKSVVQFFPAYRMFETILKYYVLKLLGRDPES